MFHATPRLEIKDQEKKERMVKYKNSIEFKGIEKIIKAINKIVKECY